MYTITRKLAVVCLAVVLSMLAYGCGGGSSKQADINGGTDTDTDTETPSVVVTPHTVDTAVLVAGLTITPSTDISIQPGKTMNFGDADIRCRDGGEVCVVTVVDNDDVTSSGGMAEALLSKAAILKLYEKREVNVSPDEPSTLDEVEGPLVTGFSTIPEGGPHTIQPGDNMDLGDANFACPVGGLPCMIENDDGTVTSAGGLAKVSNSIAVMVTRMAIALSATGGALLNGESADLNKPDTRFSTVERSPDGVTTITLKDATDDMDEYPSEPVDSGHAFSDRMGLEHWMGQTLKRDDGMEATMEDDAIMAMVNQEATVYTNIESAESGKWKRAGAGIPNLVFALDPDQEDFTEEFMGSYIRTDGTRVHGTFSCDAKAEPACTVVDVANDVPTMTSAEGNLVFVDEVLNDGWTFVSDDNVKEGETPDADYMYFGYWLKSPVTPSATAGAYHFFAFSDGGSAFVVPNQLFDNADDALEATYEGGAAGMYVTRDLRIANGMVDSNSPGTHGRFTAKAMLTAYFGTAHTGTVNDNMIDGTITEFKDGATDLGFEITLDPAMIMRDGSEITSSTTMSMFNDSPVAGSTGNWSGKFYGPAAEDTEDLIDTLPSGVAGKFEVGSEYTKVVGAFAAEKQ